MWVIERFTVRLRSFALLEHLKTSVRALAKPFQTP